MEDQPLSEFDTITVGGGAMTAEAPDFDPMLLSVLSSRFGAILREMSNCVLRASKSGVIKIARDMSCAILTYDHRLVCIEECIPVHAAAIDLTTRPLTELFDDIEEGDAFLNNCPYTGSHAPRGPHALRARVLQRQAALLDRLARPPCRCRRADPVDLPALRQDDL